MHGTTARRQAKHPHSQRLSTGSTPCNEHGRAGERSMLFTKGASSWENLKTRTTTRKAVVLIRKVLWWVSFCADKRNAPPGPRDTVALERTGSPKHSGHTRSLRHFWRLFVDEASSQLDITLLVFG